MTDLEKLKAFARWVIRSSCWDSVDLDGGSIQDKAEELGLIEEVAYDPAIHGASVSDAFDAEIGDKIFFFADILKENP